MFPKFDILSTPLLTLLIQGVIFIVLLLLKFKRTRQTSDILIAILLSTMIYDQLPYILSFMGWFEAFPRTKINYYFIPMGLAFGPIIFLYIRALVIAPFRLQKSDFYHFIPVAILLGYKVVVLVHDSIDESWRDGYEGEWQRDIHFVFVAPILRLLSYSSQLLYLAFSIQLYVAYRKKITEYFSNSHQLELNWLLLFLAVYGFLFAYETGVDMIDALVFELSYTHKWWVQFFFAVAIVFFGMRSYFTDFKTFHQFTEELPAENVPANHITNLQQKIDKINAHIETNKAFLRTDFSLSQLAQELQWSLNDTSAVINNGVHQNFNEFINRFRVEEVKNRIKNPKNDHYSLLAIAMDSGFNSKASFNRIFKQFEGQSPSEFKGSLKK